MKKYTRETWERGTVKDADMKVQLVSVENAKVELKEAMRIIAILLDRLGGSATIADIELTMPLQADLEMYRNNSGAVILTLRKK